MEILFLTTVLPRKRRMGSEVASQCFVDALSKIGCKVTVVGYTRLDDIFELETQEISVGKRYIETKKAKIYTAIWLALSLLLNLPYSSAKYYSRAYLRIVKALLSTQKYNAVIIDHPQLGWVERVVEEKLKVMTIAHNVEHEIYLDSSNQASNFVSKWIYKRESCLIKQMEDRLAARVGQVWALTQYDSKYFAELRGASNVRTFALPPDLSMSEEKPKDKAFDIGIIGSWAWKANEEGLRWFIQRVYPHLPSNLSIQIAGRGAEWLSDQYSNIQYLGFVPDAQEFMAKARTVAIPTLSGGGVQIKTLDAIASGSIIVATPIAIRGIYDPPGTVKIAKEPKEFADLLVASINAQFTVQSFTQAKAWYRTRQNNFLVDVARALKEV